MLGGRRQVDGLLRDLAEGEALLAPVLARQVGEELLQRPGAHDRAGQVVPAARLGLLDDRDRHLAEALQQVSGRRPAAAAAGWRAARPAVPPPTIATPTSISSSSASSVALDELLRRVDRRRVRRRDDLAVAVAEPAMALSSLLGLHGLGELRQDLVEVADDAEVGELEDRGVRVLVDRHDVLRGLHADLVLDRAGDARREVQLRRDGLARLADLRRVGVPAGVDHGARGGDGAAERAGELLAELEALGLAEAAAAGDEDVGVLDVRRRRRAARRAGPSSACSTRRRLDVDVLDRRPRRAPDSLISNALRRPMMMPEVALVLARSRSASRRGSGARRRACRRRR